MKDVNEMTLPEAALYYAGLGLAVLPLSKEKDPLISGGSHSASADVEQVREWWTKWPNANIGIATGQPYGLIMIDADEDSGKFGKKQFEGWQSANGEFPESWQVTTGRGGLHLYLRTGLELHNVQNDQPDHLKDIDFRGQGGYAVAPPSVHKNGSVYKFDDEHGPAELDLGQDDSLLQRLHDDLTPKKHADKSQPAETVETIEQGERNGTLTKKAGQLQRLGFPDDVIEASLMALNDHCNPPLPEREVRTIVKSVCSYDKGELRTVKTPAPIFTPYKMNDYLLQGKFERDINYFRQYQTRKTDFSNIDEYLTLYPGLAAIGGAASLGKTTFCVQLADNLITNGETVLYFSLEQEPIEIISKVLTRRLSDNHHTRLTNAKIKNGWTSGELEAVKLDYAEDLGERFVVVRCSFTTTAQDIRDYIEAYIRETGRRPIVFIDYLQLISPPQNFKGDTRAAVDHSIKLFKTMQLQNELLVILVSNFNRSSYDTPASYEDFKETGMIEYTCDYVWALQLSVIEEERFHYTTGPKGGLRETTRKEKSDMIYEAMKQNPKGVEFVSLKSRNGRQAYKCFFKYYMEYDYFYAIDDADERNPYGKK